MLVSKEAVPSIVATYVALFWHHKLQLLSLHSLCAAISLHKIKRPLPQIKAAIQALDVGQLNPEEVDILMKIAPTDEEVCL